MRQLPHPWRFPMELQNRLAQQSCQTMAEYHLLHHGQWEFFYRETESDPVTQSPSPSKASTQRSCSEVLCCSRGTLCHPTMRLEPLFKIQAIESSTAMDQQRLPMLVTSQETFKQSCGQHHNSQAEFELSKFSSQDFLANFQYKNLFLQVDNRWKFCKLLDPNHFGHHRHQPQ